jgi:hypothetical protein
MASLLSAFLTSNGAADTRYVGTQPKQDKDAKPDAKPGGPAVQLDRYGRRVRPPVPPQDIPKPETQPQQAERPDDGEELPPQAEPRRQGRNAKRLARPSEAPDAAAKPAVEGRAPAHAASERGPEGRKSAAKHRLSKRGKPGGEELPKTDAGKPDAARDDPPRREPVQEDRPQNDTKYDGRPDGANAPGEVKSEAARIEVPKQTGSGDTPAGRPDPVPSVVTPAPQASPAAPTAVSEPTAGASRPSPQPASPPAVTALVPPPPPVAPAGPPVPPISQ